MDVPNFPCVPMFRIQLKAFFHLPLTDAVADKVLEAARLCLDYCSDPEGAISILAAAQRWLPALQLSMRHKRRDLFSEVCYTIVFC